MAQDVFVPRADLADGEPLIETASTASASAALWAVIAASRRQPRSGRTSVAGRSARAARRSIACDLVREQLAAFAPEQARRDAEARVRASTWAEEMIRGESPGSRQPAAWVPEHRSPRPCRRADQLSHGRAPIAGAAQPRGSRAPHEGLGRRGQPG